MRCKWYKESSGFKEHSGSKTVRQAVNFDPEVHNEIKELAKKHGLSFSNTVNKAMILFMHKIKNQKDD